MCNLYNVKMNSDQLKQVVGHYIDETNKATFDEIRFPTENVCFF